MLDPACDFLCLQNLSKSYLEGDQVREVLVDACMEIMPGEFLAILGKSGSGKSTLLNLISGIDQVDAGQIWVNCQNLTAMNDLERTIFRRENTGFIFQFFNLIPTLTVLENVMLPRELTGHGQKSARDQALRMLEEVDLADRWDTFPDRLSGGEQQRVAIARALVHDPLLVLADEPTGNLDEETGQKVLELLDRLTRRSGKNLILVTHSLQASRYADRILLLKDGKLIHEPEDKLTGGLNLMS